MMVRSYAIAIVKPAEGKTDAVKAALEAYNTNYSDSLNLQTYISNKFYVSEQL